MGVPCRAIVVALALVAAVSATKNLKERRAAGSITALRAGAQPKEAVAPQASSNHTNDLAASTAPRQQRLRLCNAHPAGALEVFLDDGDTGHLALFASKQAIPHRQCRETTQVMRVGDYLEFRVEGVAKHVFVPAAPVQEGTVGMHVVYQKEKDAAGVYLHYFDHLTYPQIAAVDVSPGNGKPRADPVPVDFNCAGGECTDEKMKKLEFGHVVPVYPGHYDIAFGGKQLGLDAAMGESYAVLRLGDGDIMVYPPAQGVLTKSAATSFGASLILLAAFVHQLL